MAGTYCINGDFIVDGGKSLTATNVLLIIENGRVGISGQAEVHLSAFNTGDSTRFAPLYAHYK